MKKILWMLFVSLFTLQLSAQTTAQGIVKDFGTGEPVSGVKVSLLQQNISTQTNASGEFFFSYIDAGSDEISFSRGGYFTQIKLVNLKEGETNEVGIITLRPDAQSESKQDFILQLSEAQLDDDGNLQGISGSFLSQSDVYISQTSYNFSPMRFRTRGYDNKYESTYINGVRFADAERGGFNYSSLGGLNNATRNKDLSYGLNPNTFSYGNLGSNTNINTRASIIATGHNASGSFSTGNYMLRGQYTYGTGLLPNGWAFAVSGVVRWAKEGIVEGTFYNSAGLFLSAEKIINENHSLSLVAFGAPTRRAQQGATTQEVYWLAQSIYYNPYWGYQDGKKRNSRIVESFDPTAVLSHDWKINDKQRLRTGVAFHYSKYSNSALTFYNAPDPRPDYYRNLPSAQLWSQYNTNGNQTGEVNWDAYNELIQDWTDKNSKTTQIDWDELYKANYANNVDNPEETAKYMLERRHNDLMELALNSTYTNQIGKIWKLTAGIEGRTSKGMHYKTIDDLLGGKQWIDIDQFAERDLTGNTELELTSRDVIQNDLLNPNRAVTTGGIFGYNYDIYVNSANAFALSEWNFHNLDVYFGAKATYTQFYRHGHMQNGRAPENSYGKGKTYFFVDPSFKGGLTYKIDGRNRISANIIAETRAPLTKDSYVSERIKADIVGGYDADSIYHTITSEKILSYDLSYTFNFPIVRGRISAFRTHVHDAAEKNGYYDDEYRTFVNYSLIGVNRIYQGIEAGVSVKLNSSFTLSAAGTLADYHYTDDAFAISNYENGTKLDATDTVRISGLKVNNGPQMAGSVTLSYSHPKMWFADLTLNCYGNNYLDFSPNRFADKNIAKYKEAETRIGQPAEEGQIGIVQQALASQEKLKGGFMLNASIGKVLYLKDRKQLNFNLSVSNLLNNTNMISGGYQQARVPLKKDVTSKEKQIIDTENLNKFPSKYYYAWGFNLFFNVGYRF